MADGGMLPALWRGIANEYAEHFSRTQLLGGRLGAPIVFEVTEYGGIAGVVSMIDEGRYLNLIFFTDHLSDLDKTGLAGMNPDCESMAKVMRMHIEQGNPSPLGRGGDHRSGRYSMRTFAFVAALAMTAATVTFAAAPASAQDRSPASEAQHEPQAGQATD